MQTTATTPQRRPRRNTKPQKAKDSTRPTNVPSGTPALNAQDSVLGQPASNLSQQIARSSISVPNPSEMNNTLATPQRPRSLYDPPSIHEALPKGHQSGNVSAVDSDGQRNKKAQKSQQRQSGSAFINSNINGTPQWKKSQTPAKTATPSQAYAGPTFHASPAPSSLPMPKFFSKSVPELNKAKGLTARMEQEASEEAISPEGSEDSPTREKAERFQQHTREESPLDIFFRADREEKARARQDSSSSPLFNAASCNQESRAADHSPAIPSPSLDRVRHHSRHATNGSLNGLFPMDLEDEGSNSVADPVKRPSLPSSRANSAPSITRNETDQDEVAKRNTSSLALKKLLMTPQPQRPKSEHNGSMSEGKKRHTPPTKESSGPFASSPSPGPKVQILSRNKPASLPQLQKQFGSATAPDGSRPRPTSSNLRQELSAPQTPDQSNVPELPAITTPFRDRVSPAAPPPSRSQPNGVNGRAFSPVASYLPGVTSPPISKPNDVSLLENELRRVLKLGSGGATGVQS